MKKQKFMRLSAFTSAPALENSFSSPVGFQGEISVVFRGKAVSIHGWDGNSWTTIYIWNGIDPQFKFENTYQNYYLKSLTGSQESMGVSFFSVGKIVNSTPQFAGINRSTKLYDIEEVPVYTASDVGKLLTIMSNGSLAWLLTSETYMSDGSPVSSFVSSDLEEQGTLAGNAAIIDGALVSYAVNDYTSMPMTADYKSSSNQTISFWFKSSYTPAGGTWMRFVHSHVIGGGPNGFFLEMRSPTQFYFKGASHGLLADGDPTATSPQPLNDGQWHHVALSWSVTSGNEIRMWVDGQAITINNHNHVGAGSDSKPTLFIGAKQFNSPMEIDKMDITEEFIDGTEALYRFNAGRTTPAPNPYTANWIEESTNLIIGANSGDSVSNGILSTATRSSTTFHLNKTSYFDLDNYAASPTKTATYSIWFRKTGDTYVNGNISNTSFPVFSHQTLYRALAVKIMNNNQVVLGGEIAYPSNYGPTIGTLSEDINIGNWHHVVLSFSINGSGKTEVNAVIDGVAQTAYIDPAALDIGRVGSNLNTMIGADNLKSFSTGDFDSFEISKGTALSVSQMQSLYNAGRGTMSIEEASTL